MPSLNLTIDGVQKKIGYTDQIAKGIYFVLDSKYGAANCRTLDITFDHSLGDNVVQNKISKINTFTVVTSKAVDEYIQYIVFKYASKTDVEDLVRNMPKEIGELLKTALSIPFGFKG